MRFHPSIAIPIPGLPSIANQVAAWYDSVARSGMHPVSVPNTGVRIGPRPPNHPGSRTVCARILRLLRGGVPMTTAQMIAALPDTKISSIKADLSKMITLGTIERIGRGRYRIARQ